MEADSFIDDAPHSDVEFLSCIDTTEEEDPFIWWEDD